MTISQRAIEAAAEALRERDMAGRITMPWSSIPKSQRKKWIERAGTALTAYHAALAVDGLCLVPKEPTAKMIAAAFPTEGERPPPEDMKIGAAAIMILEGWRDCGSITSLAVVEAASMCKDYRNLVAAASTGDSPSQREG